MVSTSELIHKGYEHEEFIWVNIKRELRCAPERTYCVIRSYSVSSSLTLPFMLVAVCE